MTKYVLICEICNVEKHFDNLTTKRMLEIMFHKQGFCKQVKSVKK